MARVSSRALATTKRAPIESTDVELKPAHAWASETTLESTRSTVKASMTRSGAPSLTISVSEPSISARVQYESPVRHTSAPSATTHTARGRAASTISASQPQTVTTADTGRWRSSRATTSTARAAAACAMRAPDPPQTRGGRSERNI